MNRNKMQCISCASIFSLVKFYDFPLSTGMVVYANEFETKKKLNQR